MFECLLASKIPANKDEKAMNWTRRDASTSFVFSIARRDTKYSSIVRSNNLRERFSGLSILGQTIQPAPRPTYLTRIDISCTFNGMIYTCMRILFLYPSSL